MKVDFTKRAKKDFEKIAKGNKSIAINIIKIFDELENGADITKFDIKNLKGDLEGINRIRVNDHRILYVIENNTFTVLKIAHRKDVYL